MVPEFPFSETSPTPWCHLNKTSCSASLVQRSPANLVICSPGQLKTLFPWVFYICTFPYRYSVRNALGLEFLGPFYDNTKLFVGGLIVHILSATGFADLLPRL